MSQNQLSLEDLLLEETPVRSAKRKSGKMILSPKELAELGKKPTSEDEKRWTEAVWKVQRRERVKDNWINWFEACALFRSER